jgi:hypothetical protein
VPPKSGMLSSDSTASEPIDMSASPRAEAAERACSDTSPGAEKGRCGWHRHSISVTRRIPAERSAAQSVRMVEINGSYDP